MPHPCSAAAWKWPNSRDRPPGLSQPGSNPGFADAEQFFFDLPVHVAAGELGRHPDGVLDGFGVEKAVPDDAPAAYAQQGSAAVFGMVQAFAETAERGFGKRVPDLAADGGFQRFAKQF